MSTETKPVLRPDSGTLYVYLVYSLNYCTYAYDNTSETLEGVYLSEDTAKAKVLELFNALRGAQSRKDLKPYYSKEKLL